MKLKFLLTLVLATASSFSGVAKGGKDAPASITVMSYNIRNSGANDGTNSWVYRYPASALMVDDQRPDIIGMQEVLPDQASYFKEVQKGYKGFGVGREDGKKTGEIMYVLYNTKTIKCLKWGTFWLSETPDAPGMGWDAACYRTATWALMKDRRSGKKFYFIDTHLDHVGVEARKNGLQLIIDRIASINPDGYPLVLVGDFNMNIDDASMEPVKKALKGARETAVKTDDHHTFNGWGSAKDHIDYIWYGGFSSCLEFQTVTKPYMDRTFISDHFPIKATLVF